jgi:hypothetical protein
MLVHLTTSLATLQTNKDNSLTAQCIALPPQCRHYLQFGTVESFKSLGPGSCSTLREVIEVVAEADEFSAMVVRRAQKRWLNEFAWKQARFTHKRSQRVQLVSDKVFLLCQAGIARRYDVSLNRSGISFVWSPQFSGTVYRYS